MKTQKKKNTCSVDDHQTNFSSLIFLILLFQPELSLITYVRLLFYLSSFYLPLEILIIRYIRTAYQYDPSALLGFYLSCTRIYFSNSLYVSYSRLPVLNPYLHCLVYSVFSGSVEHNLRFPYLTSTSLSDNGRISCLPTADSQLSVNLAPVYVRISVYTYLALCVGCPWSLTDSIHISASELA